MAKDQRFFIAAFTGTDRPELKNRLIGLFSNQTVLFNMIERLQNKNITGLYLKGKTKNLPVTQGNICLEFKRDNHLIIYQNDRPYIKVDVKKMNEVNEKVFEQIC